MPIYGLIFGVGVIVGVIGLAGALSLLARLRRPFRSPIAIWVTVFALLAFTMMVLGFRIAISIARMHYGPGP